MPALERFETRGQPAALAALAAMLDGRLPHALLLTGPGGVGKGTLALDLAATLLCLAPEPAQRPCRACRGCRAVAHGNHPDVHRLEPQGPGSVIPIGGREDRGVRDLIRELALLPVEGGVRVALVLEADRMTEDAQSAFLKTLEEPPPGSVIVLTAADEERLLPTIRSRSVRIRLGPVPRRDLESILLERGLADPPLAARLARLANGRPGEAVALAAAAEALRIRGEVGRSLLDLSEASRADRLRGVRDLLARAAELQAALRGGDRTVSRGGAKGAGRAGARRSAPATSDEPEPAPAETGPATRAPAAERRAAALALVGVWRDIVRDLALVMLGEPGNVRQLDLLDDLEAMSSRLPSSFPAEQLRRLDTAGERLEGNVSPELVLDALAIGWAA